MMVLNKIPVIFRGKGGLYGALKRSKKEFPGLAEKLKKLTPEQKKYLNMIGLIPESLEAKQSKYFSPSRLKSTVIAFEPPGSEEYWNMIHSLKERNILTPTHFPFVLPGEARLLSKLKGKGAEQVKDIMKTFRERVTEPMSGARIRSEKKRIHQRLKDLFGENYHKLVI